MKEIIAIIGRPNTGKSSLFNRLIQRNVAIVHDWAGVTRDRNYATAKWDDRFEYLLIDTGGIDYTEDKELFKEMIDQANLAIEEATKIIFLMDGKEGIASSDADLVEYLRKFKDKEIYYVVNKIDSREKRDIMLAEFYSLGVENLYPLSVQTKIGLTELMDDIFENSEPNKIERDDIFANVAVVGRPNVGKSSFINKLLGEDRLLVHDESGTTRDAIDTEVTYFGKKYLFIDTAGVRRKARIKYSLEKFMVVKSFISIDRSDIVLIVIDATELITDQDKRLINMALEKGKPIILLLNKWDLIEKNNSTFKDFKEELKYQFPELKNPEMLFISALTGQRVNKVYKLIEEIKESSNYRVSTGELNRFAQEIIHGHPHPIIKGKRISIKFISQVGTNPPTFMISANRPELIIKSYSRFIKNQLRKRYPFGSVPIKIFYRSTNTRKKD